MSCGRVLRCAVVLGAALVVAGASEAQVAGDLDGSCSVDAADVVLLERHLTGDAPLPDEDALRADVAPLGAPDGAIDLGDLLVLQRIVVGDVPAPPLPSAGQPAIDLPAVVDTSQNPIDLSGYAPTGATIHVYVNGRENYATASVSGNQWTASDADGQGVALEDGVNTIQVQADVGGELSCLSAPVQVTYRNQLSRDLGSPGAAHVITGNEVWTPGTDDGAGNVVANVPYVLEDDLQIDPGASLVIQAGTELRFAASTTLHVNGDLFIQGESDSNQAMLTTDEPTCTTTSWQGIDSPIVAGTTSVNIRIAFARIECVTNGLVGKIRNAAYHIELRDSEIDHCYAGVFIGGQPPQYDPVDATIERNWIHCTNTGVRVNDAQNVARFRDNEISGSTTCAFIDENDTQEGGESTFTGNWLHQCGTGIQMLIENLNGAPKITNNTITGVSTGIKITGVVDPTPRTVEINNNNIAASGLNVQVLVSGNPTTTVDARYNWWGSADLATIATGISYPPAVVTVWFTPWLSAPWDAGGAPIDDTSLITGSLPSPLPSDPVWHLVGTVTVPAGTTLSLPAGSAGQRLEFAAGAQLVVDGELDVQGTPGNEVVFTSLVPQGVSQQPGDWEGVVLEDGTTHTISNAVFEYATTALTISGSGTQAQVSESTFRDFSSQGIFVTNGASADIVGNRDGGEGIFASIGGTGIRIDGAGAVNVHDNDILGGTAAVRINDASPSLQGNLISDATTGILLSGSGTATISDDGLPTPVIPGNEITDNCTGIRISGDAPAPILHRNLIYANDACPGAARNFWIDGYQNGAAVRIDAEENWWGTVSAFTVAEGIRDHTESPALPTVDFLPFFEDEGLTTPSDTTSLLLGSVSGALAQGDYDVVGSVIVESSDTWTIDEGTVLNMAPGAALEVSGELDVNGVAGNEVTVRGTDGASWDGIQVSGGSSSLDMNFATVEDALFPVQAENTSGSVAVRDSHFSGFGTAILLDGVPNGATIERVTAANSGWTGTGVHGIDSTFSVLDSDIGPVYYGVIASGVGDPVVAGNRIGVLGPGFGGLGPNGVGIWFIGLSDGMGGATGEISGNTIRGSDPPSPRGGTGIRLLDASPDVFDNLIEHMDVGIHVRGDSQPLIGRSPPVTALHNTITENAIGILVEGDGSTGPPVPMIRGNNLFANDDANLAVRSYPQADDTVIDAHENYWGSTDEATIRSGIATDATNPIAVDFTDPLQAQDGTATVSVSAPFSTIFSAITRDPESFRPTFGESWQVSARVLGSAVPVTFRIYAESDDALATVLYEDVQTPTGLPGEETVTFSWNGRQTQGVTCSPDCPFVPDEAYVYTLEAESPGPGGTSFAFLPQEPETPYTHAGQIVPIPPSFNPYENDFLDSVARIHGNGPGRIALRMLESSIGPQIGPPLIPRRARPTTENVALSWDGRDDMGLLRTDLAQARFYQVWTPEALRSNAVIVLDTAPSVRNPGYDIDVNPPIIELKPDPYYAVHSYDQVSTVPYTLDQDAIVTIKIYAPGHAGPDEDGRLATLVDGQYQTPGTYSFQWDGTDAALDPNHLLQSQGGADTFLIEAHNPSQPSLSSTYRGVLQVEP